MQNKFQNIYCFLLVIFLVSCQENKNPCSLSEKVLKDINTIDSFIRIPEFQEQDRDWNKNNYKESSLFDADNETYRFIWNDMFGYTEVYRIEKKDNKYTAIIKAFEEYDTIGTFTKFNISKEVWNNIIDSLNVNNFWIYPHSDNRGPFLDGTSWRLEGYKPIKDKCTLKSYHIIGRISPIDSQFVSMCKLLYKLKQKL